MTAPDVAVARFRACQLARQVWRPRCADCGRVCKHVRCKRCVAKRHKRAETQRRYYARNKAKIAETQRRYYARSKATIAEANRRYRVSGPLTSVSCARCGDPIPYSGKGRPPKSHDICPRDVT